MPTSNWKGLGSQPISAAATPGKDEMKERGPEARHANRQEQDPGQQAIGDWRAGSAHAANTSAATNRNTGQVAQDEGDRFGHHGLLMRMSGGLDRGRAAR